MEHGYHSAFLHSNEPMLLMNTAGELVDANGAACELLGWPSPPLGELLISKRSQDEGRDWPDGRSRLEVVGGDERICQCLASHHELAGGDQLIRLAAVDESCLEENEDLRRSNEALELSNLELQQFAYIASHDLQTPLRAVAGFARFLQEDYGKQLDAQAVEYIEQIIAGADTMRGLIDSLLNYSRIDSRSKPFEWTDLNVSVSKVVETLGPALEATGGTVSCQQLPTVLAEPFQMFELFRQLIGNAIKFHSDAPPRINVSAELDRDANCWWFRVEDNGIGIDPRYHERVFEIFRRLHRSEAYPGDGVGLAIARRIVHRHRGRMTLDSQPGEGSVFRFSLPCELHQG